MNTNRTRSARMLVALLFGSVCFGVGAASHDSPELRTAEGVSVPGAFSPETVKLQAMEARSGEMAEQDMFRELQVIRDQLLTLFQ